MKSLVMFMVLMFSVFVFAGSFKGVDMPEEMKINGKKLVLNGMGLREATKLGIDFDVYVGGLYLEKKSTSGAEILASKGVKRIDMHFLMGVWASDLKAGWREAYDFICNPKDDVCVEAKEKWEMFINNISGVSKGDVTSFTFTEKGFEMETNGKTTGSIQSPKFAQFILRCFVGSKLSYPSLRDGLLGLKK